MKNVAAPGFQGQLVGNELRGTWDEGGNRFGRFRFVFSADGRAAIGCAGRLPRMPMVASTARGPPTIRTTLVTERDNTDSPLWSSLADFRGSAAEQPTFQASEKPSCRAIR